MQNIRVLPTPNTVEIARTRAQTGTNGNVLVGFALILIMLLGGYFRFVGQNWDDYTHLHPDERFLTGVASSIGGGLNLTGEPADLRDTELEACIQQYSDTGGVGGYFDARCSNLNPHNTGNPMYVYGTLPLFMARGAGELVRGASELWARTVQGDSEYSAVIWTRYDGVHLVWRALSALAEMGVIVVVFLIGVKLHDKWIGLLAAALYAFSVLSIQMAHFGTADAISNFFCALALLYAVCVQREGKLLNYILFGVALGAALASRINLAPMAGVIVLAAIMRALPALDRNIAWGERERYIGEAVGGVILAGAFTIIAFRVFNPYAFVGPGFFGLTPNPRWLEDLAKARQFVTGEIDFPPNFQWASRPQYFYPLKDMVLWGMGAGFGLAGWLSFAWSGYRILRGRAGAILNLLPFVWVLVYFGYMGIQWVMNMRYFTPIYPALAVLAAWGLITFAREAEARRKRSWGVIARGAIVVVAGFSLLWSMMFTNVYRNLLTRVAASHWVWENVASDFAMRIDDAPEGTPLINIGIPQCGDSEDLLQRATCFNDAVRESGNRLTVPISGTISEIYAPHLGDPNDDPENEVLRFTIRAEGSEDILGEALLDSDLPRDRHILGDAYTIPFDQPVALEQDRAYIMLIELVDGGNVVSGGSVFTWEGAWDDPVPTKVCELPDGVTLIDNPPSGLVDDPRECIGLDPWWGRLNGHELNIVYEDTDEKRRNLVRYLNESDYIAISSNRFYDSMSRNPLRFPMTQVYYDALFDGSLGYDLVAQFDQTYEFGPLRVSDQHLPNYTSPDWLNELESDEAFSVYDHPAVFIFQKRADYNPIDTARILYDVPLARVTEGALYLACENVNTYYCDTTLTNTNNINTSEADLAPTQLRFTDEMWQIQEDGGTWSERFFPESPINTNLIVSIAGWWGVIVLFGWAAYPLLFALLPGLADRGYALAKFMSMFLIGWALWYLASARIPVWSGVGVAGGLIVIFLIGVFVVWRTRSQFGAFIRAHVGRLVVIELITLVAFLAFVAVRLSNPDLWHPNFGGEKPMDFAYFNGVLRSTIFPPIDPWNATGFINYYYFGFVIVGTPVLLTGMIPSIAYNLILPTLFASTGIGAYTVAYSAVNAWRERRADGGYAESTDRRGRRRVMRVGSPFAAGIAALVFTVVLGNLDTPRVFLTGVANLGGYVKPEGLQEFLLEEYAQTTDAPAVGVPYDDVLARAQANNFSDRVRYELDHVGDLLSSVGRGFGRLAQGDRLPVNSDRWFWGPSRILAETPGVEGNAITEMPAFTFVYGDLHAHMIAMPMQFFLMAFLLNEVLTAGDDRRRGRWLAVVVGAITMGMLRATNTWDWITYLVFGTLGLGFAWWLRAKTLGWAILSRRSIVDMLINVGGFVVVSFAAVFPYTTWFVTTYSSVRVYEEGKTPLWAYFDIHGLFLFLIVSLLIWDTARWFRSTRVSALRGKFNALVVGILIGVTLLVAAVMLAIFQWQVTLIALPLLAWAILLFFRADQSRAVQFILAAAALGLALTLGVEYIVLDGDIARQNTIFKFYLQAWLLFSVVGGVAFAAIIRHINQWGGTLRTVWTFGLVTLVAIAALFPVMATLGKSVYRMDEDLPITLDGMAYMRGAVHFEGNSQILALNPTLAPFPLGDDYDMIRWMQDNIQGSPIIMEGSSDASEYKWNARVAIYTGLPSVVGWNFHQRQQRALQSMGRQVEMRVANVNAFYQTQDIETAWTILRFYEVGYVVVSNLERAYYTPEGLAKLEAMMDAGLLSVVYQENNATVYEVNRDMDIRDVETALITNETANSVPGNGGDDVGG